MALHRIIHIGDLHSEQADARQPDRRAVLEQILAHIAKRKADGTLAAITLPGDFHDRPATLLEGDELSDVILKIASFGPFIGVPGNHDGEGDLRIFTKLDSTYTIKIVEQPNVVSVKTATGKRLSVFCLPYPHKARLVGAGVEHEQLGDAARSALEPIFIRAAALLTEAIAQGDIPFAIGHVNVGGSIASTGQPQIGKEIELDIALMERLPEGVPLALNHIHKHQAVGRGVYAGSSIRNDYGEAEDKGFIEWTFDDETRVWTWAFIQVETPEQLDIEGTLTRTRFLITKINGVAACEDCGGRGLVPGFAEDGIGEGPCDCGAPVGGRSYKNAYVRVTYYFSKGELSTLDVAKIDAEFAETRGYKREGVPLGKTEVRAPEVIAAVTLHGKAEAFCHRAGLEWTPGIADKLDLLQTTDRDRLTAMYAEQPAADEVAVG